MEPRSLIHETARIVALEEDPVLRNLLITQCYHDLSTGLAEVVGQENANWCNFATWASKTAGDFIRKEEVPALFRKILEDHHGYVSNAKTLTADLLGVHAGSTLDHGGLLDLAEYVVEDVSDQITIGNLKVFAELGPIFATLIGCYDGGSADEAKLAALYGSLKPGPSDEGGQDVLRKAIEAFVAAQAESDAHQKAELMLLTNGYTGLHEQIRLQPYIAGSLDAPVEDSFARIWDEKAHHGAEGGILGGIKSLFDRAAHLVVKEAEKAWEIFATKALMTLAVPGQVLHLGGALPPPVGGPLYPPELTTIDNEELAAALTKYGALDADGDDVAATDWADLDQRMKYIFALFRSRQQVPSLFDQPFTTEQHAAIVDDQKVPSGKL